VSDRDELAASWAETERDLRAALAQVDVGADVSRWVTEYLDHNELGLAFATLVEALDQRSVAPPRASLESLAAAYERMKRPSDGAEAWARLKRRSPR
jgi:hypothetical protein